MPIWIKLIPYAAAIVGLFASYGAGYYSGLKVGDADCRLGYNEKIIEQREKNNAIRESIEESLPAASSGVTAKLDWLHKNAVR